MWDNAILLRNIASALIVFSALVVLYGVVYYLMHLPGLFPIRSLHLSAAPHRIGAGDVLAVARSGVRGNLFTADIERLRESLEKLPWVRSASIRREFPDALTVHMEEHHPVARWNSSALLNQQGEIFVAESEQALPQFIGQEGTSAEMMQRYGQFSRQLDVLGLSVAQVSLSPRHAWQLRLSNGTLLELGREDMEQRLARFVSVQMATGEGLKTGGGTGVKHVDLRYRNGFAVRELADDQG